MISETKNLEHFLQVKYTKEQVQDIGDEKFSLVFVLLNAQAELAVLEKLTLLSTYSEKNDEIVKSAAAFQMFFLQRLWTAKTYESVRIFYSKENKEWAGRNSDIEEFFDFARKKMNPQVNSQIYNFAKSIRNKSAFHTEIEPVNKYLKRQVLSPKPIDCNYYFNLTDSRNDVFEHLNSLVSGGQFQGLVEQLRVAEGEEIEAPQKLLDWLVDTTKEFIEVSVECHRRFVPEEMRLGRKRSVYVAKAHCPNRVEYELPVFARSPRGE